MGSFAQQNRTDWQNPFDPVDTGHSAAPNRPAPALGAPATQKTTKAKDLDYAKPWADELDDVLIRSKARADDDAAVVSTEIKKSNRAPTSQARRPQSAKARAGRSAKTS